MPRSLLPKVVIVGATGAGKTAMVQRQITGYFTHQLVTIPACVVRIPTEWSQYAMWDAAGTERFRMLTAQHINGADLAVLAFDLTDMRSFEAARSTWLGEIMSRSPSAHVILVGTKADLIFERAVDTEAARRFAEMHNFVYLETSAVTGENVDRLFRTIEVLLASSGGELEVSLDTRRKRVRRVPMLETDVTICCCSIM